MIEDLDDAAGLPALDEDDFARLDDMLAALANDEAMVLEELDGYLAALACAPEPVAPADYLPVAMGLRAGRDGAPGPVAADDPLSLMVRRHARDVQRALDAQQFAPVLAYDERGQPDGSAWAVGFLRAVEAAPESWDAMLGEQEFGDALDSFEALASTLDENGPDAPARLMRREREALIERMMSDVADIHEFFRPYRQSRTTPQALRVRTMRRAAPKVGRNDPCPCGSGRKYKACCGAV